MVESTAPGIASETQRPSPQGRPLRFMQIHTFYSQYLASLYDQRPNLAQTDFATQMRVLEQDGFSAIHMFGFHLAPLGYQTQVVIGNNLASQYAWAFENGMVTGPRRAPSLQEILIAQVEAFDPDILYLSDPINYDSRFVRLLSRRPRMILGWRAADVPTDWDVSEFDVMLSCLKRMREAAIQHGAREALHFYPGLPMFLAEAVKDVPVSNDVCFYGQVNPSQYQARIRDLHDVTQLCLESGISLRMHLSGNLQAATPLTRAANAGPLYGLAMYAAIKSSRLIFDVRGSIARRDDKGQTHDLAGKETANMRLFEATGLGACLVTEQYDNLGELFTVGKEIVTYSSKQELLDVLRYYHEHEEERSAIAAAGLARCRRDHSMETRLRELDTIIRARLPQGAEMAWGEGAVPFIRTQQRTEDIPDISGIVASLASMREQGVAGSPQVLSVVQQAMEFADALLEAGYCDLAMAIALATTGLAEGVPEIDASRNRILSACGQQAMAPEAP